METPIRILQIIPSAYQGSGILQVVLNWHRHIDRTKVQFDYLFSKSVNDSAQAEIEALGGRVCELPHPYQHPVRFLKEAFSFFKRYGYHTVHSHMTNLNLFFYPLAKVFGAKNIIQHAHGTKWSDKKLNGWRNYLMLHAVWPLITHKLACSKVAGLFWYGNNFTVVNNGIEISKFDYNPALRTEKRKELGLENNFVIGNIGRFALQKNHSFLLKIFEALLKKEPAARLVLIGNGPLENEIKESVNQKQLQDKVLFLGIRKDVPNLLQVLDVFCMPSFYEGLPVVGVEAQAAGLPCVFADTITPEVLLLPGSCMLSLRDLPDAWMEKILSLKNRPRTSGKEALQTHGFAICQISKQMQDFYLQLK